MISFIQEFAVRRKWRIQRTVASLRRLHLAVGIPYVLVEGELLQINLSNLSYE